MTNLIDDEILGHLAACLDYPGAATPARARAAAGALELHGAPATIVSALADLAGWLESAGRDEAEERYTRLFDLQPVCTLNVGYHLFGETYQRGAFLANLAAEIRRAGLDPGTELPDFLPTLVRLLGHLDDEERSLLAHGILSPALAAMGRALEASDDPWPALVRALPQFLAAAVERGVEEIVIPPRPLEVLRDA